MALNSALGNMATNDSNDVIGILSQSKNNIETIVGETISGFANRGGAWQSDVTGISETGVNEIVNTIDSSQSTIANHLEEFKPDAIVTGAFKGTAIETAVTDFITQIKILLNAYVSMLDLSKRDVLLAYENYKKGAQDLGTNLGSDAQSIKSEANNVQLD